MKDETWESVLQRMMQVSNSSNESVLASRLGLSAQSVYNARKKQQIPPAWVLEIAKTFNVTTDWLFFGRGPMRISDLMDQKHVEKPAPDDTGREQSANLIERLDSKLERELELEREERRELAADNRRLYREKEQLLREKEELLREIGELREKVARLEERKNKLPGLGCVLEQGGSGVA